MNQVATQSSAALIEQVVIGGDLAKLSASQRVTYYRDVCDSLGLNPLTRPFLYITLNGKLVLYASRDCTDQLRSLRGVSVKLVETKSMEGVFVVRAQASDKMGRTDESTGAVSIIGLKGEALANALMKAETKAKRRVTLSICGLGIIDESEVDSVRDARPEQVDTATGEISPPRPARQPVKVLTRETARAAGHEDLDERFRQTVAETVNTETGEVTETAPTEYDPGAEYQALWDGAMEQTTKGARTQYWAMQREEGAAGFTLYQKAEDLYKELAAKIMASIKALPA